MKVTPKEISVLISKAITEDLEDVDKKMTSIASRIGVVLGKSEKKILNSGRHERTGRLYRVPFTKSATYNASAPGEPPAKRTGTLWRSWASYHKKAGTRRYLSGIHTNVPYAGLLEEGTPGGLIAPRPYRDKIIEDSMPRIREIVNSELS